ncbi:MAG TPA: urate oxidase [Candidatus Saccharimonadales bacterium]|nr:urate oxidase [Candidatus Saccharimonadales bacterium]
MERDIEYGKAEVTFYRTYAAPLVVTKIPESAFIGRENLLFAASVDVDVYGANFLPAYTDGDNSNVVATDTMKNFIYAMALDYEGATLEGFAAFLARRFLTTYPPMEALRIAVREQPFSAAGDVLFGRSHDDLAHVALHAGRSEAATGGTGEVLITAVESGRHGLQLIKLTGSSFTRFLRDEFTTLPETVDRPLYIHLDVHWKYGDLASGLGEDLPRYVHAEQVRDLVQVIFDRFNSRSIQHLVDEIGQRMLERFPQLSEVRFDAQNRTWETVKVSERDPKMKVYTDPHGTYGKIGLVLRR